MADADVRRLQIANLSIGLLSTSRKSKGMAALKKQMIDSQSLDINMRFDTYRGGTFLMVMAAHGDADLVQ